MLSQIILCIPARTAHFFQIVGDIQFHKISPEIIVTSACSIIIIPPCEKIHKNRCVEFRLKTSTERRKGAAVRTAAPVHSGYEAEYNTDDGGKIFR